MGSSLLVDSTDYHSADGVTTTNCACNGCGGEDHPSTTASQRTKRHYTEADPAVWGHTSSAYGSNPAKGCAAACFRNETDNRIKTAAAESYPNGRSSTSHKGCKVSLYDSETKRCFLYDHGMTSITNQGASKFTCWASQHECHSNVNCQHHNPTPVPTRPPTLSPTQHPTTLPPTQTQWTIIAHQVIANGLFSAADRSDYAAGSSPSDNVYMALPSNHASYKNSAGLYTFRLTYRGTSTGGGTGWDEITHPTQRCALPRGPRPTGLPQARLAHLTASTAAARHGPRRAITLPFGDTATVPTAVLPSRVSASPHLALPSWMAPTFLAAGGIALAAPADMRVPSQLPWDGSLTK